MKKVILTASAAIVTGLFSWAQEQALPCGIIQATEALRAQHPGLYELELQAAQQEEEYQGEGSERALKVIPVVVHVLHNYGNENISDAQIYDAIRILNEDFQKRQPDTANIAGVFKPIQGDVDFEFRLARKDPNGNCTNGITRTVTPHTFNANEDAKTIAPTWPRNKYMNVWVVNKLENGAGGYTYTPGTAQWMPSADGIILVNRQFGGIGTSTGGALARRTLSHEVGHWFNLRHTWGDGNTPGVASNCNQDDGVNDTPNTQGVATQNCNTAQVTCSSLDNVQNIMDYSSCPIMFTVGQANRMITASNSGTAQRSSLWTAGNLTATGVSDGFSDTLCVPIADFNSDTRIVCAGSSLTFEDLSYNGIVSSRSWTFTNTTDGVTVLTANTQNPSVNFTVPGLYTVALQVSNAEGSNTRTKAGYVRVYPATAQYANGVFFEDFEGDINTNGWFTVNDNALAGWQISSSAFVSGSKSMMVKNYLSPTKMETYALISPSVDLSQISSPKLKFKYAYANRENENDDRLRVYISANCGASWQQLSPPLTNANLESAPVIEGSQFVPTAAQWKEKEFSISNTFHSSTNVRFKFEFSADGGNNLYLDDVNLPGLSSVETYDAETFDWEVFPNPASNVVDIRLSNAIQGVNSDLIVFTDASGRVVKVINYNGAAQVQVDITDLKSGVYFIRSQNGLFAGTKKLIVR